MESIFWTLYLLFFFNIHNNPTNPSISDWGNHLFPLHLFSWRWGGGWWIPTLFPPQQGQACRNTSSFHLILPYSSPGQEEDLSDATDQWLSERVHVIVCCLPSAVAHCVSDWVKCFHFSHILQSSFVSNKDDILISTCLTPAFISQFWMQEGQKVFIDLLKCHRWLLLLSLLF